MEIVLAERESLSAISFCRMVGLLAISLSVPNTFFFAIFLQSSGTVHKVTLHVPFLSDPSRAIRPCSFSHATFFSMVVELSSVSSARRTIVILGKKYNNRMMEYLFTPNFFFKGLGVFTPNFSFSPLFYVSI